MTAILHVLDHSLPLQSGYTFRTRAILKAQQAAGWPVAALTGVRQYQGGQERGSGMDEVDGLRFFRTTGRAVGPSPIGELREVNLLAERIVELHREWPFDILHAHSPALNGLAAVRAGQKLGIPVIYEIRAFWEDAAVGNGTGRENSARYFLTRTLETHVARQARAVAVICRGLRNDLVSRGIRADKIVVTPNGVDLSLFGDPPPRDAALADELGLADRPVMGFVGSFYDYEGLDILIEGHAHMGRMGCEADLLLVGGGPMEDALRQQAAASPFADHIHFTGRVPHGEVERYYSLCDLMVYPRKKSRLTDLVTPLKPLEAMAQGQLVAASDVGGHRELIEDGVTGTLFAADDPAAMADAISALLSTRENWDDRRVSARQHVRQERDWAQNVHRYDPVYQMMLGRTNMGRAA